MGSKEVRVLTVEHVSYNLETQDEHDVPLLRLKGLWLRRAGFVPGSRVRVEVEDAKLILTPQK